NQLRRSTNGSKYATLFYGIYQDDCRVFSYVNAGHNPPILLRNGRITYLNSSGTVIGLFPDRIYEQVNLQLLPNDFLVLYTDGVVEARNGREEEFGEERLQDFLSKHQDEPAKSFISDLLK